MRQIRGVDGRGVGAARRTQALHARIALRRSRELCVEFPGVASRKPSRGTLTNPRILV